MIYQIPIIMGHWDYIRAILVLELKYVGKLCGKQDQTQI